MVGAVLPNAYSVELVLFARASIDALVARRSFSFFCARPADRGTQGASERQSNRCFASREAHLDPLLIRGGSFVLARGPTLANYSYAARPQEDAPACLR